jgi:hypothetical protein
MAWAFLYLQGIAATATSQASTAPCNSGWYLGVIAALPLSQKLPSYVIRGHHQEGILDSAHVDVQPYNKVLLV